MDYSLLKTLCNIHAPSGNESAMTDFIVNYIEQNKSKWKVQPQIFAGNDFQNCIILVFGNPRAAVYAHMDNIGFTVRYNNELVMIGKPHVSNGYHLCGTDSKGVVDCYVKIDDENEKLFYTCDREIDRGTDLSFKCFFKEEKDFIQSCYMDNRLGVFNALQLCESLENGAIAFTCWEEHGGGSAGFCAKFLFEKFNIRQALISDITWITEGVHHGEGVVVSMRDTGIPRRIYVNRIIDVLLKNNFKFQLEVEGSGGSDGTEIQKQPYPIDWFFIGAGESNVHSPDERVHKADIESMIACYKILMASL